MKMCVCVSESSSICEPAGSVKGRSTIQTAAVSVDSCRCYSRAGGNDGDCGYGLVSVNRVSVAAGPCKCLFFLLQGFYHVF